MGEFTMPSLGADMEAGVLTEWKVKTGDSVKRGDIIAEVETQKGVIEIEVFEDGIIEKILIEPGQEVPVGTVLAIIASTGTAPTKGKSEKTAIEISAEDSKSYPAPKSANPQIEPPVTEPIKVIPSTTPPPLKGRVRATPLARKMAEEMGIDLAGITGTGEDGIIVKEDIEKATSQPEVKSPEEKHIPEPVTEKSSVVARREPIQDPMRKAIAAAMSKSNREIPHYFLSSRFDMKLPLEWLETENKKRPIKDRLLPPVLFIKAIAKALELVPDLNASWINDALVPAEQINIGMVISLRKGGIIVPAIPDANKKSLDEIMQVTMDITLRARESKLKASDINSATVTLTNLGDRGAEAVYGLIYPPQVAIIGIGKVSEQPWAEQGMLDVRPVVTVTLVGDHRATDGQAGSRFLEAMNKYLQQPELL
jgi:pyruvate dehydrogenase E2 component (dihydrolipoamide acetyltransferase)